MANKDIIFPTDTTPITPTGLDLVMISDESDGGKLKEATLDDVVALTPPPEWGDIEGTLSDQTDLQSALDGKQDDLVSGTNIKTVNSNSLVGSWNVSVGDVVWPSGAVDNNFASFNLTTGKLIQDSGYNAASFTAANSPITGATKTKITYDAKGLVTAAADATTADINDSYNKRYVTDAQLTVIGNTSGTNTGDNAPNSLYSGLAASKEDTINKSTDVNLGTSDTLFPTQNAVKQYVDTVAQGLNAKPAVKVATTTVLPTVTYSNGTAGVGATLTASANGILTIDGVATVLGDRILIKNQASGFQNGIYTVTTEGTVWVPFVLTRATDMNQAGEINSSFVFVTDGTVQADSGRVVTSNWPFTVGTTAITWTQFSGSETFNAGTGLQKVGTTFSIDSTVATLTWTQVLTNKTIALGSNTVSGTLAEFNTALTGADFASLAGAETLTNKILGAGTQLGENSLKLDASLSGDETRSGITTTGTAGATIAVGDICYLASSGKWLLTDGILDGTDTGFSKQLGICILASTDTNPTEMLLYGKVRSAAFPSFTTGSPLYLSNTDGDITGTQPATSNHAIRIVGFALSADDLMFNPSNDWIVRT